MSQQANYARLQFQQHLGPDPSSLDVPWADFAGDRTDRVSFAVPAEAPREPYVELQVYDVGAFTHEIQLNGTALSGFDIPPSEGWQYWMDTIGDGHLTSGENTLRLARDTETDDAFAVGTAIVHWKEPAE